MAELEIKNVVKEYSLGKMKFRHNIEEKFTKYKFVY